MKGKTVVITGANQGIGKAAAIELARAGAAIVIVCRNAEKGAAALAEVKAAGAPRADLVVADLASQAEVRRAATEIKKLVPRLDVLLNNAGVFVPSRRVTVDGIEETFAVNHLAPFLLTRELDDLLRASGAARVVNVSSDAHKSGRMHWDDLELTTGYSGFKAYCQSKLANILFTYELAKRFEGTAITTNALHPGVIASGFGQTYGGGLAFFIKLAKPFMLSTEAGAKTSIYLASSPEVSGVTGKYFAKCREVTPAKQALEPDAPAKLWAISERMVAPKSAASAA